MDHENWYAYVYPKSLGAHDSPKLGVAATVKRLEVAADPDGTVYFHNVRVNGILLDPDGPSIWTLLTLLNSRLVDWVFRLGAAEHANGYYAANKQFIARLPIRTPAAEEQEIFTSLGKRLHHTASQLVTERKGFLAWLSDSIGARTAELQGSTILSSYDDRAPSDLIGVLLRNQARLSRDVGTRAFREEFERELAPSIERAREWRQALAADEAAADDAVFELYGLTVEQRRVVEGERSAVAGTQR